MNADKKSGELHELLKKHWGYDQFRPFQEEAIQAVLNKKDTLALMPTGGGKSICFQLPAMHMEGMCLVVSPLIALMKDQVNNLRQRNITAVAIHSGMSYREVDLILEKCMAGHYKFLYLSPERLTTDIFRDRLPKMKINLLAVDEAHCVSQWGYDFRPPYLRIAEVREGLNNIPVLALTASATKVVCSDIMEKLQFKKHYVVRRSFERKNLSYSVLFEEDKFGRLLKMLDKVRGTAIVYVRNRRRTKEIALFLQQNKVSATDYHAGLSHLERSKKQEDWIQNKVRVIVCTNAFGMGIDKPDVRLVVHWDVPDNLESYFQEAGRAGRDEKKSFAVILYNHSDITELNKREADQFPDLDKVKIIYNAIGNFCKLAEGSGLGESFNFDLNNFIKIYKFNPIQTLQSLKLLAQEEYLSFSESVYLPSRIMMTVDKESLYRYEVMHPEYEALIKTIMRSYGGVFDYFSQVREEELAKALNTTYVEIIKHLRIFHQNNLMHYEERNENPQLFFLQPRLRNEQLCFNTELLNQRKESFHKRAQAILHYLTDHMHCRNESLLKYFDEDDTNRCGICDVCLRRNKLELSDIEFENIIDQLKKNLKQNQMSFNQLLLNISGIKEEKLLHALRWLIEQNMITENESHQLHWN